MYPIPANATRIRYLESTGTQWIDTGLSLTHDTRCEIVLAADWSPDTSFYLCGPSSSKGRFCFGRGFTSDSRQRNLYFGLGAQNYVSSITFANLGTDVHSYRIDAAAKTAGVDGSTFSLTTAGDITGTPAICLLCQIQNNRGFMKAKLYSAKYWQSGSLAFDGTPVRVGQTGYLFDRVSGQLFGNAGTGSFVLGPDTFQHGVIPTRMMVAGVRKNDAITNP